jgi:hypothetical protein
MSTLKEIVFDALHPAALARFWAAALDGYRVRPYDDAEVARLAAQGLTPETDPNVAVDGPGPTLFFQRTTDPKRARNRVHLDVAARDRRAEVERLLALGATLARDPDGFTVLRDPEGNEFCVVERR